MRIGEIRGGLWTLLLRSPKPCAAGCSTSPPRSAGLIRMWRREDHGDKTSLICPSVKRHPRVKLHSSFAGLTPLFDSPARFVHPSVRALGWRVELAGAGWVSIGGGAF